MRALLTLRTAKHNIILAALTCQLMFRTTSGLIDDTDMYGIADDTPLLTSVSALSNTSNNLYHADITIARSRHS